MQNGGTRQRLRWSLTQAVAACVTVALALEVVGCGSAGTQRRDDKQERMNAITTDIQTTLAKRPDVAQVNVNYIDDITGHGFADVSIQVKADAAFEPVREEALRMVWQSMLDPLKTIRVAIVDAVDTKRNEVLYFAADGKDKTALEEKYGPRPK